MTPAGVKKRIIAFLVLSAVGVVYASANYLGIVDRVLGRGYSVTAMLPGSGGLYEGSEVTYRGVQIGKVSSMQPRGPDVLVKLALDEEARVPTDSPVFVHNGSAVGEQYLDFEPAQDDGPFLREGDTIKGDADSLPVDEADLLVDLDQFVRSVDKDNLRTVVSELGDMFYNTGRPLGDLIDGGTTLVDDAVANQDRTIRLLENGRTVLRTQQANADNILDFASGLAEVTATLKDSDQDIRLLLQGGPGTLKQLNALMKGLKPTLPVLLSNLVTVNQVTTARLASVEQLLVTYPVIIASGFSGTTENGYGHVHLENTNQPPPCTKGYLPSDRWRRGDDLTDGKAFLQARCAAGAPYAMRGSGHSPKPESRSYRVAPYDPATGTVMGGDKEIVIDGLGASNVYGGDAWKWMLVGPTLEK